MTVSMFIDRKDGEWFGLRRREKIACCDCGLVHRIEFRLRRGVVQARAYRDARSTANRRRTCVSQRATRR